MSYFREFPLYQYDIEDTQNRTLITDILRRVNLKANVRANTLVFDSYDVKDGETPDIVASKYYNDPGLHWIIITVNNITSRHDWPLDQPALTDFVNDKYGTASAIHHYEVAQTSGDTTELLTVSSDTAGALPVTNYEYEQTRNDKKRKIRLLDRVHTGQFIKEFKELIQR
jgi:hypothetical protein